MGAHGSGGSPGLQILNKDNYATGGLYFGGYTYQALGGGIAPTNWEYATPQTVYLQGKKRRSDGRAACYSFDDRPLSLAPLPHRSKVSER